MIYYPFHFSRLFSGCCHFTGYTPYDANNYDEIYYNGYNPTSIYDYRSFQEQASTNLNDF